MTDSDSNITISASDYQNLVNLAGRVAHSTDLPICAPEAFNGDREKTSQFTSQLCLYFFAKSSSFKTDRDKVLYAISRLEGIAFKWIQPFISRIGDEEMILLNDFDTFISKLEEQFGVSTTVESCEAKLFELKQISSVLDYGIQQHRGKSSKNA